MLMICQRPGKTIFTMPGGTCILKKTSIHQAKDVDFVGLGIYSPVPH
jgi:hypothetical protein